MIDLEELKRMVNHPRPGEFEDIKALGQLPALIAEIERLRAIVAKLPKTADGVPVVPGVDYVYSETCTSGGATCYYDHSGRIHNKGFHIAGGVDHVSKCYSTREAARARVSLAALEASK